MVTKLSFDNSSEDCLINGAFLASVTSTWEQEFLTSLAFGKHAWIGGHNRNQEKSFVWLTGEDGPQGFYDNFKAGSPTQSSGHNCIQMNGKDGAWKNVDCNKKMFHFCQKESSVDANSKYNSYH